MAYARLIKRKKSDLIRRIYLHVPPRISCSIQMGQYAPLKLSQNIENFKTNEYLKIFELLKKNSNFLN